MPGSMALPAPALPRYVELVRVSSQGQADRDTPQDQRAALDRLRASRPGVLVARIDEAISGALAAENRSDVRRLFELAAAKAFDEVRVRHVDRLTRHDDPRERFAIYGAIRDAGAVIVDASGHVIDPRGSLGEVDYYLQTWMAAGERRRIIERTRAAKDRLVREGRLVHGRPPFGRTWDKKKGWGIDAPRADVYRRLFELVLEGRSLRQIAAALNAEGIPTPAGREWGAAHVSKLVRDPAASGHYETHGTSFEIPSVVDRATQDAAMARLRANNALSGPRPTVPALLRKLATCGVCGSPMYVDKGGKTARRRHYYVCSSGDDCAVNHRLDVVDAVVREAVEGWLRRPAPLLAAAGREAPEDEAAAVAAEVAEAERELRDLDRQEERVARLLRRTLISARVGEKQLEEVARLRIAADARRAAAVARGEAAARRGELAAELEARVAAIREGLVGATWEDWRALCVALFPRTATTGVRIHPDGAIELLGTVPLDARGEQACRDREPSTASGAA
jgi:DNA invertase Pin-like site-specific DNA recombinase